MYNWQKNEDITAKKLNASQTRPYMENINKAGVGGALDQSAIDPGSTLACFDPNDPGSVEVVDRVEITEHDVGNMKYNWNKGGALRCGLGTGRWQIETGWSGVTGKEQRFPEGPVWLDNCSFSDFIDGKKPAYVWDKITTNKWGVPQTITRVYDSCKNHSTYMWNPSANEGGIIWRQMGHIKRSDVDIGSREPGVEDTHVWEAVNYNSAVIMPVTRPIGRSFWDSIYVSQQNTPDAQARYSKSHYVPLVGTLNGNTAPVLSAGELGGTVIKLVCACGDMQGIGFGAGVEFYDGTTLKECYNCDGGRPNWTTACVSIGYGGNVKVEALRKTDESKGTCYAPWQFLISAKPIKISCMEQDMGSTVTNIVGGNFWGIMSKKISEGSVPPQVIASAISREAGMSADDDYHWGQYGISYTPNDIYQFYDTQTEIGLASPYVASVVAKSTTNTVLEGTAGEFNQGVLGIPIARWDPAAKYGSGTVDNPYQAEWNAHGGLIRGILADIPLSLAAGNKITPPFIDSYGFIHIYAPYIPECLHPNRFDKLSCYISYICIYNLCGQKHVHDPWNH